MRKAAPQGLKPILDERLNVGARSSDPLKTSHFPQAVQRGRQRRPTTRPVGRYKTFLVLARRKRIGDSVEYGSN